MNSKRKFLSITSKTIWVTPFITSVTLPIHARMSGMSWSFEMLFNENCLNCLAAGDENDNIIAIEPPIGDESVFEITEEEIYSGEISIFLGDPTDFRAYKFLVLESSSLTMSGLVEKSNDAGAEVLRGTFDARII